MGGSIVSKLDSMARCCVCQQSMQPHPGEGCGEWNDAVSAVSKPLSPSGQPINHSANLGDKRRLGGRVQVPRHPAAPPDRVDQRRKSDSAACNGPDVDAADGRGGKGIGVNDVAPDGIGGTGREDVLSNASARQSSMSNRLLPSGRITALPPPL